MDRNQRFRSRLRFSLFTLFFLTFVIGCYLGLARLIGEGGSFVAALVLGPVAIMAPWLVLLAFDGFRPRKRVLPDADEAFGSKPAPQATSSSSSSEPPDLHRERHKKRARKWRSPFIRYKYD